MTIIFSLLFELFEPFELTKVFRLHGIDLVVLFELFEMLKNRFGLLITKLPVDHVPGCHRGEDCCWSETSD